MSSVPYSYNTNSEEWPALPNSNSRAGPNNGQPAAAAMSMDTSCPAIIPVLLTSRPPAMVHPGKPTLSVKPASHQPPTNFFKLPSQIFVIQMQGKSIAKQNKKACDRIYTRNLVTSRKTVFSLTNLKKFF
jgi:hypothetical protein